LNSVWSKRLVIGAAYLVGVVHLVIACAAFSLAQSQQIRVSGHITISNETSSGHRKDSSNVAIWLEPRSPAKILRADFSATGRKGRYQLVQRNKQFEPHLLVVPVGAEVRFPNNDVLFHSVFSMFNNQRFDLGLYEAGTDKAVVFNKPGISYIFCNIHAQMSATVIALETPYFAVSNREGEFFIPNVPVGEYMLNIWAEGASADLLKTLRRIVTVNSSSFSLGTFDLKISTPETTHKNKYDSPYDPPSVTSSYEQR
jgi:plastocyanin